MRGRGGMGRGRGGAPGMKPRPPFIPHVPFDIVLAEPAFPPVRTIPTPVDEAFQAVGTGMCDTNTQSNGHYRLL